GRTRVGGARARRGRLLRFRAHRAGPERVADLRLDRRLGRPRRQARRPPGDERGIARRVCARGDRGHRRNVRLVRRAQPPRSSRARLPGDRRTASRRNRGGGSGAPRRWRRRDRGDRGGGCVARDGVDARREVRGAFGGGAPGRRRRRRRGATRDRRAHGVGTLAVKGRGLVGALERSWSGEPGSVPWSLALLPLAGAYAIASGWARRTADRTRLAAEGVYVVAVGNLTAGGTGKSSIARWLAAEIAEAGGRGAVLLRGHGADAAVDAPAAMPDFAGMSLAGAAARYGDEALAHRAALPRSVAVIVDPDRARAASSARRGYGATVAILDDGWEQRRLAWNEIWVTLDPSRPCGNGHYLPAGPLRRPPETLARATVVAFLLESEEERVSD